MRRGFWVFIHRWAGLALAGFLIIVGVTGALLAFNSELERIISPQLYAAPRPGAEPLDLASLARRAEAQVQGGQAIRVGLSEPDQAEVWMVPRNEGEGGSEALGFNQLFLDPYTGGELGRRSWGEISEGWINLMPFIYALHFKLALGRSGFWIMGVVALVWTLDCFVGFYLTLPRADGAFWRRWKPAWLVKWRGGAFRINFDLHRAGGLWLWAALLIFAWSSVYMNLTDTVYAFVTRAVFDYRPAETELPDSPHPLAQPRLDFRAALLTGERLAAEEGARQGFTVERAAGLAFDAEHGVYCYTVRSSREVGERTARTSIYFDANSGALRLLDLPSGQYSGNTVTAWLAALHKARVFGLPYRIFVCALGLSIAVLSVTGVYIWWRKRLARKFSAGRRWRPVR